MREKLLKIISMVSGVLIIFVICYFVLGSTSVADSNVENYQEHQTVDSQTEEVQNAELVDVDAQPNDVQVEIVQENSIEKINNEAIIVVPGISGVRLFLEEEIQSRLYFNSEPNYDGVLNYTFEEGRRLWDPERPSSTIASVMMIPVVRAEVMAMKCDEEGNSIYKIRSEYEGEEDIYGANGSYTQVVKRLIENYGQDKDVIFFSYDWRRDMSEVANELENVIETNGYDKVTLVCHSLGGLVASRYMANSEKNLNKVDKFVSVATPFLGTPKALYVFETGGLLDGIEDIALKNSLKQIVDNFSAAYDLIPREEYFSLCNKTYLNSYYSEEDNKWLDYEETKQALLSRSWCIKEDGTTKKFVEMADDFYDGMFINGKHITNYVDSYYIIGYGRSTVVETYEKHDADGNFIGYEYTSDSTAGDGSVPVISAEIGGLADKDKCYYVEDQHTDMIDVNTQVVELISNLIAGNPKDYDTSVITQEPPMVYGR